MMFLTTSLSAAVIILLTFAGRGDPADETLIREFPDALIYRGVGLYHSGDYRGATQAWKRYITIAPAGSDTLSVREMIKEAEGRRLRLVQ